MAETTTTSTTNGVTTVSKTTTPDERKGKAWIKKGNSWVKPAKPKLKNGKTNNNVAWDDNKGWITAASQATAYDIPLAIIDSDKGLKDLFARAWAAQKDGQEWTQETFLSELKILPWYKSKSVAQRKYYVLSKDPSQEKEFEKQINDNKDIVLDTAGLLGAKLTEAQAIEIAKKNLQNGFSTSELKDVISTYISYSGKTKEEKVGSLFGEAGKAEDTIRSWAKKNNVTLAEDWILRSSKAITSGNYDVNKSKDYITKIAKRQYSAWADQIDNENTVEDLAAGFIQTYATEFDEPSTNINLKNKYIEAAMKSTDDKGRPIDTQAFATTLRGTNEWSNVAKNKEEILGIGQDILSRFGMR